MLITITEADLATLRDHGSVALITAMANANTPRIVTTRDLKVGDIVAQYPNEPYAQMRQPVLRVFADFTRVEFGDTDDYHGSVHGTSPDAEWTVVGHTSKPAPRTPTALDKAFGFKHTTKRKGR